MHYALLLLKIRFDYALKVCITLNQVYVMGMYFILAKALDLFHTERIQAF